MKIRNKLIRTAFMGFALFLFAFSLRAQVIILPEKNTDGILDTSFADEGVLRFQTNLGGDNDAFSAAAVAPDGKIVLAGTAEKGGDANDVMVIRLNTDGSLDSTFNSDGRFFYSNTDAGKEFVDDVVVKDDGSIVVLVHVEDHPTFGTDPYMLGITADGEQNTAFGTDGANPLWRHPSWKTIEDQEYHDLTIAADGRLVAVGTHLQPENEFQGWTGVITAVSANGKKTIMNTTSMQRQGASVEAMSIEELPDGEFLVGAQVRHGYGLVYRASLPADFNSAPAIVGNFNHGQGVAEFPIKETLGGFNDITTGSDGNYYGAGWVNFAGWSQKNKDHAAIAVWADSGNIERWGSNDIPFEDSLFAYPLDETAGVRDRASSIIGLEDGSLLVSGFGLNGNGPQAITMKVTVDPDTDPPYGLDDSYGTKGSTVGRTFWQDSGRSTRLDNIIVLPEGDVLQFGHVSRSEKERYATAIKYQNSTKTFEPLPTSLAAPFSVENKSVVIYPNPAREQVTVEFDHANPDRLLRVFNLKGQLMYQTDVPGGAHSFSLQGYPAGVYQLQVASPNSVHSQRLIVR